MSEHLPGDAPPTGVDGISTPFIRSILPWEQGGQLPKLHLAAIAETIRRLQLAGLAETVIPDLCPHCALTGIELENVTVTFPERNTATIRCRRCRCQGPAIPERLRVELAPLDVERIAVILWNLRYKRGLGLDGQGFRSCLRCEYPHARTVYYQTHNSMCAACTGCLAFGSVYYPTTRDYAERSDPCDTMHTEARSRWNDSPYSAD